MKIILITFVFLIVSCGGRETDPKSELLNEIEMSQSIPCRHEGACAIVDTGCNISCSVAVHFQDEERIVKMVEQLEIQEAYNSSCELSCAQKKLACNRSGCALEEVESVD